MALYNVQTSGQTLLAIGYPAHATSELILQNAEDTDFESVRETRVHWQISNISTSGSSADTLITSSIVQNGDRFFIRKNDGSIVDTFASGVSSAESAIIPAMTSNTLPEGTAYSTYNSTSMDNAYKAFDGDPSTGVTLSYQNDYLQYTFKDNTPTLINRVYLKTSRDNVTYIIYGSVNGTDFSTISSHENIYPQNGLILNIDSPGEFSTYRIRSATTGIAYYNFDLLGDGVSVDTSAITAGETPDQVFLFKDTISFNGAPATEKDIYYEYGNTGTKLYVLSLFEDVALTGRQIQTRVDFYTPGNTVTEITGQVYKELV